MQVDMKLDLNASARFMMGRTENGFEFVPDWIIKRCKSPNCLQKCTGLFGPLLFSTFIYLFLEFIFGPFRKEKEKRIHVWQIFKSNSIFFNPTQK
jgi:hypothetical protein